MDKNTCDFVDIQRTTNTDYLIPGNIIPHEWYKKITDNNGNPDFLNIIILADIIGWYRYLSSTSESNKYDNDLIPELEGNLLGVSYKYFQEKFSVSKERIRKAFVRLENLEIIFRKVQNVTLKNGSRNNKLFLNINIKFFNSCFQNPKFDARIKIKKKDVPCPQYQGDYICNKNINKIRSIKSSFIENNSKKLIQANETNEIKKEIESERDTIIVCKQEVAINKTVVNYSNQTKTHILFFDKPKTLSEFYPLSEEDGNKLQSASGRKFSLHAMNEILKSLSNKLHDRLFRSKQSFMRYMEIIFKNEMRDAVKISNNTFKIRPNSTSKKIKDHSINQTNSKISIPIRTGIWGNIRSKIAEYLGRNGDAIDAEWLSKLEAEIDEKNKQIKLKAPDEFHRKNIIQDFEGIIRIETETQGFVISEIYC